MPKYHSKMRSLKSDLRDRVFGNSLILEHILNFVIHDGNEVSPSDVRSCRLVQNFWLQSVSACLRKSREPVFHVIVSDAKGPKSLQKIADAVKKLHGSNKKLPPIKVEIEAAVFKTKKNGLSLHLPRISEWMVSLHVEMSLKGCPNPAPFITDKFSFPNLKELCLRLSCEDEYEELNFMNSSNLSVLIQSFFFKCPKLESFIFYGYLFNNYRIPMGFDKLELPKTLTTLNLFQALNDEQLVNLLSKAVLPRITTLAITLPPLPLNNNQVSSLLNKFSNTLKSLNLQGLRLPRYYNNFDTVIHVPMVMETLKVLTINAVNYRWSDDTISVGISNLLPNLRSVTCVISMDLVLLRQLTENSRFLFVEDLSVEFVMKWENLYPETSLLDASKLILQAFPNVLKLNVTVQDTEVEGLQHIFRHMTQLKELSITARDADMILRCPTHSQVWDSIILDLPLELLNVLRKTKPFWRNMEFCNEELSSILNLTNLQKFSVKGENCASSRSKSLISDIVFHFGFLKMPNLRQLNFAGGFKVSRAMAKKWKEGGRILEYCENAHCHRQSSMFN